MLETTSPGFHLQRTLGLPLVAPAQTNLLQYSVMNTRLKKLQQALVKHKVDALIVRLSEGDNQNVLYLSGFGGTTAVLVISKKHAFIVTDARYYTRAVTEAKDFKLVKVIRGKKVTDHINEALALAKLTKNKPHRL